MRRNDETLEEIEIHDWENDALEILDALKNNSVVKVVQLYHTETLRPVIQEARIKLSEVMRCNKSVECLVVYLEGGSQRERLFAAMATSGGWSSIQELVLSSEDDEEIAPLSLTNAEDISSFIIQSENLNTLRLDVAGDEAGPIVEALSGTKVQSLKIHFHSTFSLQNGGRRLATALERCTGITELRLKLPQYSYQMEFFQILLVESIPKMLGLKELEVGINPPFDQQFFDVLGQSIVGHQGEIEVLRLMFNFCSVNSSIVGLAPALRRLKVIQYDGWTHLTPQQTCELSGNVADCDALEEFDYNLARLSRGSIEDFKAICQLLSKFPSLKRVTQLTQEKWANAEIYLQKESRFVAFLEMVKTSKTIEQVPPFQCGNAEEEAAIKHHCHNNMMYNRIELIRENGLLAVKVPGSAWPVILKEFSDMPDVLYYLLQQKHGAMIGPMCQGCKRKQDFD